MFWKKDFTQAVSRKFVFLPFPRVKKEHLFSCPVLKTSFRAFADTKP